MQKIGTRGSDCTAAAHNREIKNRRYRRNHSDNMPRTSCSNNMPKNSHNKDPPTTTTHTPSSLPSPPPPPLPLSPTPPPPPPHSLPPHPPPLVLSHPPTHPTPPHPFPLPTHTPTHPPTHLSSLLSLRSFFASHLWKWTLAGGTVLKLPSVGSTACQHRRCSRRCTPPFDATCWRCTSSLWNTRQWQQRGRRVRATQRPTGQNTPPPGELPGLPTKPELQWVDAALSCRAAVVPSLHSVPDQWSQPLDCSTIRFLAMKGK